MKKQVVKKAVLICCMFMQHCLGVSFVYNLRIAEITKRQITAELQKKIKGPLLQSLVLINQMRKKNTGIHQNIFGALESLIFFSKNAYLRADWAFGRVSEKLDDFHFSRTQTDDILVSGGFSHAVSDRTKLTFSSLLGIPTHNETGFEGIQFGTGHVGFGLQIDNAFIYSKNKNHSLRSAVRYIRFFERTIIIALLQGRKFKFNLGNLTDLYIAHHSKFGRHSFELGYNPSFLFGPSIRPIIQHVVDETTFIRSNMYVSYQQFFFLQDHPSGFATAISYGLDHTSKLFGLKRIITFWAAWGINF